MFEKEAEEYAIENWEYYEEGQNDSKALKQAYLAGVKAGRSQWHDLRKDPNDLQKAKSILTLFLVANDNDDIFKAQREAWAFLGTVDPNARFEVTGKGKEYLSSH